MKLDKKFTGTIIKVKDGSVVPDDQWVVFLAKDTAFANAALTAYLEECVRLHCDDTQIQMVTDLIARVHGWRHDHEDLCKIPDAAGEPTLS